MYNYGNFTLEGKTAIVVGGSKGLSKGMAAGLASAGANVVLVSRKQPDLDAAAKEITEETGNTNVIGMAKDITSLANIDSLVNDVVAKFGQIDILINGAGINVRKPAVEFTEEDWDQVQNTQLKYVFFMNTAVIRHMKEKNIKGKIINIASLTSQLGLKNMISYCCAKGAIVQMTKALANEHALDGICVNAIGPGYYETEMTKPLFADPEKRADLMSRIPTKRFGLPEDLQGAAIYLASPASDYVTGQVIYVDGGWLAS